jgi:fibronectin type 3 domain-containing protein
VFDTGNEKMWSVFDRDQNVYFFNIKDDGKVGIGTTTPTEVLTVVGNLTVSGTISGNLTGTPLAPTASANTNTTQVATTAYVQTELTDLINGAPGTLDTLNELAAAINDDANYNSTLTTALATKLPLAGGTLTGNLVLGGDDRKITFGAGNDLEIYHSGSDSYIRDVGQGGLSLTGSQIILRNAANNAHMIRADDGGAVGLYRNSARICF